MIFINNIITMDINFIKNHFQNLPSFRKQSIFRIVSDLKPTLEMLSYTSTLNANQKNKLLIKYSLLLEMGICDVVLYKNQDDKLFGKLIDSNFLSYYNYYLSKTLDMINLNSSISLNNKDTINKLLYDLFNNNISCMDFIGFNEEEFCREEVDKIILDIDFNKKNITKPLLLNTCSNIYSCFNCKSKNVLTEQIQTKAADEATTTVIRCLDCGRDKMC